MFGVGRLTTTMAEVEVAAPTPVPEPVAPAADAAPALPKERIAKPTKPDRSQLDAQITTLREQISKCHDRMAELRGQIDDIKGSRQGGSEATKEPRSKLVALRTEIKALYEEKNGINNELKALDATRDAMRAQQKAIREKCQYVKVEDIDTAIDRLENEMAHSTMSLNEEKKIIAQISDLKKSRVLVKELYESNSDGKGKGAPASRDEVMDRLRACQGKIKTLRQQEDEQRKILDEIRAKFDDGKEDIPTLIQLKADQFEIVKQCKETIGKLRDDFKKVEDDYWTKQKLWWAQQKEEKQKRWEAAQLERKQRDLERKQRDLENAGEPFDREVTTCEQLITYMAKYQTQENGAPKTAAAEVVDTGVRIIGKKNVNLEEEDGWWGGYKGSGKKSKGKKKAKAEKLVHSMDIISSFATLGLSAPLNKAAMPELVKKIDEKKAEYLEKRVAENEKRKAAREAAAAAAAAGIENPEAAEATEATETNGTAAEPAKEEAPAS